ncbi:hypothetical protein V6N11_022809 [Hibiscus sabdariffa]|uniref:Uncharacterized protein n=1 Tax=Hibiscus sabdariffa TaxID=183260 RepID=A0ABR2TKS1_9ROSI
MSPYLNLLPCLRNVLYGYHLIIQIRDNCSVTWDIEFPGTFPAPSTYGFNCSFMTLFLLKLLKQALQDSFSGGKIVGAD